jgi:hypothetical protein
MNFRVLEFIGLNSLCLSHSATSDGRGPQNIRFTEWDENERFALEYSKHRNMLKTYQYHPLRGLVVELGETPFKATNSYLLWYLLVFSFRLMKSNTLEHLPTYLQTQIARHYDDYWR